MTQSLIFKTPGLIDLRSFTVVGFNAKPNTTNPIGYFGTGLKYSVAVLCRLGASVSVYIGLDKYTFYTKTVDFRGKKFEQIWLRSEKWKMRARNTELPYTTEYGKNWKPWMVIRELESNTRDENGYTTILDPEFDAFTWQGEADHTTIIIQCPEILEAAKDIDKLFINEEASPIITKDSAVSVRQGGGEGTKLYYRGVRAKDVVKPTFYTYDFTNTHGLTEDRTFESEYWVRSNLGSFVATCDNEEVIEKIITADDTMWEHGLEIPQYVKPSEAFHRVMARRPRGIGGGIVSYYSRHDPRPVAPRVSLWASAPRPWRLDGTLVVDADNKPLFEEPINSNAEWRFFAEELIRVAQVFQQAPGVEEVKNLTGEEDAVPFG